MGTLSNKERIDGILMRSRQQPPPVVDPFADIAPPSRWGYRNPGRLEGSSIEDGAGGNAVSPAQFAPPDAPPDALPQFNSDEAWNSGPGFRRGRTRPAWWPEELDAYRDAEPPEARPWRESITPQSAVSRLIDPSRTASGDGAIDVWGEALREGRINEGMPAEADNTPLDQASLNRLRGETAEQDYSPLSEEWGWLDLPAGLVTAAADTAPDLVMQYFDEDADQRMQDRRRYLGGALRDGVPAMLGAWELGDSGDLDWNTPSEFWSDREGADSAMDWIMARPGQERRADIQQTLGDMDARSAGVEVAPDLVIEGERPTLGQRLNATIVEDFWQGPSVAARGARRDAVTGFATADTLREQGDEDAAREQERLAGQAALTDTLITGSGAIEFAPGIGAFDLALGAGRLTGREALRATVGLADNEMPWYLNPVDWSPTAAYTGRFDEGSRAAVHDPGMLTRQASGARDSTLLGATAVGAGAYAADELMDGEGGDLNQAAGGALITGVALAGGRQLMRGGRGIDPLADIAPRAEAGAARELDNGTRVYEDGYARTTIEPDGRIVHTYQGGYQSGGGVGGEAVSSMRSALRALEQDIEQTGRASYSWRAGPDDAPDARLADFYRNYFRERTPPGYVFSESADGTMHLNRVIDAEATPVRIGEQVNRDGSVTPRTPIDWEADVVPERSAMRDLGIGGATLAAGGLGGYAAGELLSDEAQASDGSGGDGVPMLPILGAGVGAATLPFLLRRGQSGRLADQLNSQVGMFAGVNARTADRAALERAQQMAAQGASRDDIWRDTGWFQGVDGKWRFEIDDRGLRARVGGGRGMDAESPIYHPDLLQAYPERLQETRYAVRRSVNPRGEFRPQTYASERRVLVDAEGTQQARQTAVHELQHWTQDAEDFARGGNPNIGNRREDIERLAREAYEQSAEMTDDQLMWELTGRNGPRPPDADMLPWDLLTQRQKLEWWEAGRQRAYNNLAGEVEARNTEYRRLMTPEQRRSRPPWETQDVPDDQQIIRFDGDRAESRATRRMGGSGFDSSVNPERGPVSGGQTGTEAVPDLPPVEQTRTNVPRGAPAGAREYLDRRNARILELIEEMQPVRNARSGAANPNARMGERLDNGYRAIAERLREEGYGEVTNNVIKGVVNRSRGRAQNATAEVASASADEAAAQRLGMSVERYRSLSARKRNDAIAALGLTGAGGALLYGTNAEAEDAEVMADGRFINPELPDIDLSEGNWLEQGWTRTSLADGSEALMRSIEGPDGEVYTIVGVQGRSGEIDFLGTVQPTEGPPGPHNPVGDVYEYAYDNSLSAPYEPPPREEGSEQPDWLRPLLAGMGGVAARTLIGRGAGRITQDAATGATAFGLDTAMGGDWTESVPVAAATYLGARGVDEAIDFAGPRIARTARDIELLADPAFRAERDAFAETLPTDLPSLRVMETENYHGEVLRPDEGLFGAEPFVIPDRELAEQGYSFNRPVENMPTQREQFLDAYPAQQRQWMDEARRGEWRQDRGQIGFASGIDDTPAPGGGAGATDDPLDGVAPRGMPPMNRRTRGERTGRAVLSRAGTRPAGDTMGGFIEAAKRAGVTIARGRNNRQTAENIANAVRENPRQLEQLAKDWGLSLLLTAGGVASMSAGGDPLEGVVAAN